MRTHISIISIVSAVALATAFSGCSDSVDGGEGGQGGQAGAPTGTGGAGTGGSSATGGSSVGGEGGLGGGQGVTAWLGDEPHLELVGTVGGKAIDFSVDGGDASDLGILYCERNYIDPAVGDIFLEKVELKFNLEYDGKLAEFQLELVKDALLESIGDTLSVGTGEDAEVNAQLTTLPDEAEEEQFEDVATSGSVKLELLDGTPADGVIPDQTGSFGIFIDVTLESGGTLKGSFTVNCGDNDIEVENPPV